MMVVTDVAGAHVAAHRMVLGVGGAIELHGKEEWVPCSAFGEGGTAQAWSLYSPKHRIKAIHQAIATEVCRPICDADTLPVV